RRSRMRIRNFSTPAALARALASDVASSIARSPRLVLALPTGRTPLPLYRELVRLRHAGRIDFAHTSTFNLDEFLGLGSGDPHSYRSFMHAHLFDHINLHPQRIHFLDGTARDIRGECARYERAVRRAGGIDLEILGLGQNGHIGFNEPSTALQALTHCTTL